MQKRKRAILIALVAAAAVAVVAAGVVLVVGRSGRHADQLVGSWEGRADERTRVEGVIGEGKMDLPVTVHTTVKATFHKDGTLDWSFRADGGGVNFWFEVPDPKKPGEVGRWEVVRFVQDGLIVRLIFFPPTGGGEYQVSFRGPDEFELTLTDSAKGAGPILFRRSATSQ